MSNLPPPGSGGGVQGSADTGQDEINQQNMEVPSETNIIVDGLLSNVVVSCCFTAILVTK